ncbi:hypothetical protein BACPEC_00833 [[Bacteroides] pectinophilus ATCC 43243]|uniref:Uncharacterized protein n=1 Tax=[Bacteroides] pectinophilus ATCC 43243 TaxID=483218 RepID=B7AQ77_9FIRM|nr:hypothetical protein BACPEC_00833 [[Bacteroides] pectinophilus ATCC 43243]
MAGYSSRTYMTECHTCDDLVEIHCVCDIFVGVSAENGHIRC